jgi:hypothetical protein
MFTSLGRDVADIGSQYGSCGKFRSTALLTFSTLGRPEKDRSPHQIPLYIPYCQSTSFSQVCLCTEWPITTCRPTLQLQSPYQRLPTAVVVSSPRLSVPVDMAG